MKEKHSILNIFAVTIRDFFSLIVCIYLKTDISCNCVLFLLTSFNQYISEDLKKKKKKKAHSHLLNASHKFHNNDAQPTDVSVALKGSCLGTSWSQKYLLVSSNSITGHPCLCVCSGEHGLSAVEPSEDYFFSAFQGIFYALMLWQCPICLVWVHCNLTVVTFM